MARGLSQAEVAQRQSDGRQNILPPRTGKTVRDIVVHNVFTRINLILAVLFAMVLATGSIINGAFGLLIIVNSSIGIIQELRAKRTLESLTVLGEEHPSVWRDGTLRQISQEDIVLDDLVALKSGNQIMVDGDVVDSASLYVDESLLTGESDPVEKHRGDHVLSGSYVVAGTGSYTVTKVGAESYAARLAQEASRFTLARSELQAGINKILFYITWILIPVGILTIIGQTRLGESHWRDIVLSITGALVPMVPEGLVLITSTAFALGIIRLGRRNCLVQELPAIEGLARVDVVCADKTGTLTDNTMVFDHLVELVPGAHDGLAHLAATDPDPNSTMVAIREGVPCTPQWTVRRHVPFTSATKYSGTEFDTGTWILGAPDVLAPGTDAYQQADQLSATGLRVLLVARCSDLDTRANLEPVGLVVLNQKVREDAGQTLSYFESQDVTVKVISGDHAASVGAVTRHLGIESGDAVDARNLDEATLPDMVENRRVFGRVTPDQKRSMVHALQERGHTVAMTGDGVNDVLALKDSDIGVAMGSGAPATRSVAKIVLLDNKFATLPHVVAEGRRVIDNIERVANLFLTKTIYSSLLAILVFCFAVPFPFLPIHVTITGWFTIGIPAFLLSLPPSHKRAQPGFASRVLRFAIPAGIIVGTCSFVTFMWTGGWQVSTDHDTQSTAALASLIIASSWVLAVVARPWAWWKIALITLPVIGYGIIFSWPVTQDLFTLPVDPSMMGTAFLVGGIGAGLIEILWWLTLRSRLWE